MARQLRVEFHGALYHVLSRGNERNLIFRNDSDRDLFIKTLKESAEIAGVEVIAYVLMDNRKSGPDCFGRKDLFKIQKNLQPRSRIYRLIPGRWFSQTDIRRGPVAQVRALLAGRLVRELGIPQAEAPRLLGVTTPAIAKALKWAGTK